MFFIHSRCATQKFWVRTQTWFATRSTQNPIWVPLPRLAIKILKGHNPKTQIAIFRTTCNKPGAGKDRNQIGCEPTHSTTHRYIVPGPRGQTGCLTDILSSPPAPGVSHRHPLLTPRPPSPASPSAFISSRSRRIPLLNPLLATLFPSLPPLPSPPASPLCVCKLQVSQNSSLESSLKSSLESRSRVIRTSPGGCLEPLQP